MAMRWDGRVEDDELDDAEREAILRAVNRALTPIRDALKRVDAADEFDPVAIVRVVEEKMQKVKNRLEMDEQKLEELVRRAALPVIGEVVDLDRETEKAILLAVREKLKPLQAKLRNVKAGARA